MATMNISLPDKMKEWIEAQVATGKYANVSDFMRDLLREKQTYEERLLELRADIQTARQSGISNRSIEEIMVEARKKAKEKGLLR